MHINKVEGTNPKHTTNNMICMRSYTKEMGAPPTLFCYKENETSDRKSEIRFLLASDNSRYLEAPAESFIEENSCLH